MGDGCHRGLRQVVHFAAVTVPPVQTNGTSGADRRVGPRGALGSIPDGGDLLGQCGGLDGSRRIRGSAALRRGKRRGAADDSRFHPTCRASFAAIACFGCSPTSLSTSCPFLNSSIAGIASTWNCVAVRGL